MKRKFFILFIITLLILLGSSTKWLNERKNNTNDSKMISLMIQDESGKYIEGSTWPKSGYKVNVEKSQCNNGTKLTFVDNSLSLSTSISDKCQVYFDKAIYTSSDSLLKLGLTVKSENPSFSNTSPEISGYTSNIETINGNTSSRNMSSYQDRYYTYSDQYIFDSNTGTYSLVNPKIGVYSSIYNSLKNNYVVNYSGSTSSSLSSYTDLAVIYKIGSNTTSSTLYYSSPIKQAQYEDHSERGVYQIEDDYGTSYYFRGEIENNYVKFGKWNSSTYRGYYNTSANAKYKEYSTQEDCQSASSYKIGCELSPVAGKDMYWRIIRINGDGSIRMIYDGTEPHANGESSMDRVIGTGEVFNSSENDNTYLGYMYGLKNGTTNANRCLVLENDTVTDKISSYTSKSVCEANGGIWTTTAYEATHSNVKNSDMKIYLDNWYKTNIVDSGYSKYVSDEIFCNDRSLDTTNSSYTGLGTQNTYYGFYQRQYRNESPELSCPQQNDAFTVSDTTKGNGKLTYPIGLITADEAIFAGGKISRSSDNYYNTHYYLYKGYRYWSLTSYQLSTNSAFIANIETNGEIDRNSVSYSSNFVAPVINLSPEYVSQLKGTGTMTDPYTAS